MLSSSNLSRVTNKHNLPGFISLVVLNSAMLLSHKLDCTGIWWNDSRILQLLQTVILASSQAITAAITVSNIALPAWLTSCRRDHPPGRLPFRRVCSKDQVSVWKRLSPSFSSSSSTSLCSTSSPLVLLSLILFFFFWVVWGLLTEGLRFKGRGEDFGLGLVESGHFYIGFISHETDGKHSHANGMGSRMF